MGKITDLESARLNRRGERSEAWENIYEWAADDAITMPMMLVYVDLHPISDFDTLVIDRKLLGTYLGVEYIPVPRIFTRIIRLLQRKM